MWKEWEALRGPLLLPDVERMGAQSVKDGRYGPNGRAPVPSNSGAQSFPGGYPYRPLRSENNHLRPSESDKKTMWKERDRDGTRWPAQRHEQPHQGHQTHGLRLQRQCLEPLPLIGGHPVPGTALVAPAAPHPLAQPLGLPAQLLGDRAHPGPLGRIRRPVLAHHPNRSLPELRAISLRCRNDSILSRVGVSGNPGTVHSVPGVGRPRAHRYEWERHTSSVPESLRNTHCGFTTSFRRGDTRAACDRG